MRPYFHRRRHQPEWEAATTAGLRAAEREGEVLARAAMRHGFFLLRRHAGDIPAALEAVHLALEGYRRAGFAPGEGTILTNLALHYGQRGQMRHALGWQQAGIANARSLGRPISLGRGLNMAGLIHSYLGELDQALVCTIEAIETHVRAGHRSFVISPRINRAIAHHSLGRYEEALADGTEALRLCRSHQQQHSEAGAHEILARIRRDTGRLDLADTHAERALRRARETGDPADETDCLITLAGLHRLRGRPDRAVAYLEEALRITHRCDFRHQEADARTQLARARLAAGDTDLASHHGDRAPAIARALELRPAEHRALTALAAIARTTGATAAEAEHTAQSLRIREETGYHPSPADESAPVGTPNGTGR
ncbi:MULTISPECIES: tetratricopeptide repeat protein [unclassified Streptomyces]|uniref:tetratricopeptide repeat protein n=1 Tax=unclassified Streptomyces TaxID=2593676 RepID=UPI00333197EE